MPEIKAGSASRPPSARSSSRNPRWRRTGHVQPDVRGGELSPLPDILAFLQRETELTRGTLVRILKDSGPSEGLWHQPAGLHDGVRQAHQTRPARAHRVRIKYDICTPGRYEMRLFEESEIEEYLDRLYAVQETNGTLDDGTDVVRTPYD